AEHGFMTRRASDARETLYLIQRESSDVVLLDVHLPDISGYQLCRRLRDDYGDSIGIILISGERKESMDRVAGMLLGADDYMVKPFILDELLARVQRLAGRARPLPRAVVAGLTRRELEILRLLACGLDHAEIARDLVIAPKTVEKHIEHILLKLGGVTVIAHGLDEEDLLTADDHRLFRPLRLAATLDQLRAALIGDREVEHVGEGEPIRPAIFELAKIGGAVREKYRLVHVPVDQ